MRQKMIDKSELLLRLKIAIEFNRKFYPSCVFPDMVEVSSLSTVSDRSLMNSGSKASQILARAIASAENIVKMDRKNELYERLKKQLGFDKKSTMHINRFFEEAIKVMPSIHRQVARKDNESLNRLLPIMRDIYANKLKIETYSGGDEYESLHKPLPLDLLEQNPLHIAALTNDPELFVHLILSEVFTAKDCKAADIQGLTPLHIILLNLLASSKVKSQKAKDHSQKALTMLYCLLDEGWIKIDEPCLGNETLLHFAARTNNAFLCEVLIRQKANVNVVNKLDGSTPLHYACQYDNIEVARSLLKNKADISRMNRRGATPRSLAKNYGSEELIDFIKTIPTLKCRLESVKEDQSETFKVLDMSQDSQCAERPKDCELTKVTQVSSAEKRQSAAVELDDQAKILRFSSSPNNQQRLTASLPTGAGIPRTLDNQGEEQRRAKEEGQSSPVEIDRPHHGEAQQAHAKPKNSTSGEFLIRTPIKRNAKTFTLKRKGH